MFLISQNVFIKINKISQKFYEKQLLRIAQMCFPKKQLRGHD